jgi:hypothetical protein
LTVDKFIYDLKARLANRVQLTTDGNRFYFHAIAGAFHDDIDYAVLMAAIRNLETPAIRQRSALEHHVASLAIHYVYYTFCRIHQTLRVTPAMAAGVSDHPWDVADIVGLLN